MRIVTLRTDADMYCPIGRTCPSIHDVDTDPTHRYVIFRMVTESAELAVFASVIEAGEVLGFMPADFIPADNPMLERTQAVGDPALRTDRQYVILSPVTDTDTLTGFAYLMAPDEHLGRVPANQLQEV
jgi:hypothetical protein